nr:hypothetical protein 7 [Deltaproteobacteria bacterium]
MALVDEIISSFTGGVSQQPAGIRKDNQCTLMENCFPTLVDGMRKRPNSEYLADLALMSYTHKPFVHAINRDTDERYFLVFTGDATTPIQAWDMDGNVCAIRYGTLDADLVFSEDTGVKSYLETTTPRESIKAQTIADYTVVTNREKVCAMSGSPDTTSDNVALVWLKTPSVDCTYKILVDGNEAASHASSGSVNITSIMSSLANATSNFLGAGWTVSYDSGDLYFTIQKDDNTDFTVKATDTAAHGMKVIHRNTQRFTDLPPQAPDGYVCEIVGDEGNSLDSWFVKFNGGSDSAGVWEETRKEGLDNAFAASTMPHRLVRTGALEFTFAPIIWEERQAGDDESNAEPSFIGKSVNGVFLYKNRLGFLAGENAILSKASDFFNFWRTTVLDLLDSDPIDIAASSEKVSDLYFAIAMQRNLVLTSDQQQFNLGSGDLLLTPKTTAMDVTTRLETSKVCPPVGAGPNLFFATENGGFTSIREYFVQPDTLTDDAADVTAHAPEYVPDNVTQMIASGAKELLLVHSDDESNAFYVYKYFWAGQEKVQSAWFKWIFEEGSEYLGGAIIANYIYLIIKRGTNVFLERIDLENISHASLGFRVHLDSMQEVTGSYEGSTHLTTWTTPGALSSTPVVVDSVTGLQVPNVTRVDDNTVITYGDYSANMCFIGEEYTQRFRFSEFVVRSPKTNTDVLQGRLQILSLMLSYVGTGGFTVEVTGEGRSEATEHTWYPQTSTIGEVTIESGKKNFMVFASSEGLLLDIVNSSYLPATFVGASWQGNFTKESRSL